MWHVFPAHRMLPSVGCMPLLPTEGHHALCLYVLLLTGSPSMFAYLSYSACHHVCLYACPTHSVITYVYMSFLLTVSPYVSVCLFYSQSGGEAIKQRYYDAGGEISARQLPEKLRDRCQGLRIISLVDVTIANGGRRSERRARSISSKCKTFFLN